MGKKKVFYNTFGEPIPAERYKGAIIGNEWLIITKDAFESFCKERNIPARDFLKFLSKQGALRKFGRNLYGRRMTPSGRPAYHYYINLRVLSKLLGKDIVFP